MDKSTVNANEVTAQGHASAVDLSSWEFPAGFSEQREVYRPGQQPSLDSAQCSRFLRLLALASIEGSLSGRILELAPSFELPEAA